MKNKAETLSEFIVNNWHFCPVSESVTVKDCDGWKTDCDKCQKCVVKNCEKLG